MIACERRDNRTMRSVVTRLQIYRLPYIYEEAERIEIYSDLYIHSNPRISM